MADVEVWLCPPRPVAEVASLLGAAQLDAVGLLRHTEDRHRSATGRALLRAAVAQHACLPMSEVRFEHHCGACGGPHGKPAPVGLDQQASLSHAGGIVVVAVATRPVGVDVEQVDAARFAGFADVALTAGEQSRLCSPAVSGEGRVLLDPGQAAALWVRKEALLKVGGVGLARDPRSVELGPLLGRDTVIEDVQGPVGIIDLEPAAFAGHVPAAAGFRGHVAAVALAGRSVPVVRLRVVATPWDVVAPAARTPTP